MQQIKVVVTKDDIDNGVRGMHTKCPVSLALKRLGFENPVVGRDRFTYAKEDTFKICNLPQVAKDFIRSYDNTGWTVEPVEFWISI